MPDRIPASHARSASGMIHQATCPIAVDLDRRRVIDVLPRSAVSTAAWLAERPSIEQIARDRDGVYANTSRQGARLARIAAFSIYPARTS